MHDLGFVRANLGLVEEKLRAREYMVGFESAPDGSISAFTPGLPIAVSAVDRVSAREKIVEAIQIYCEEMESAGFAIPEPPVEYEWVTF